MDEKQRRPVLVVVAEGPIPHRPSWLVDVALARARDGLPVVEAAAAVMRKPRRAMDANMIFLNTSICCLLLLLLLVVLDVCARR